MGRQAVYLLGVHRPTAKVNISVQLDMAEARELWDGWVGFHGWTFPDSIKEHLLQLTDRQPGMLVHAFDWLEEQGLHNCVNVEQRTEKVLRLLLSSDFLLSFQSLRSLIRCVNFSSSVLLALHSQTIPCHSLQPALAHAEGNGHTDTMFVLPRYRKVLESNPNNARAREQKEAAVQLLRLLLAVSEVTTVP